MSLAFYVMMPVLVLVDTGISVVAGSLELTSFPAIATDGKMFTMMCTGGQGGLRVWSRDKVNYVLRTQTAKNEFNPDPVSPNLTGDLVGRINVSSSDDGTQHNVTLLINARPDNGDVWRCRDETHNDTSNALKIIISPMNNSVVTTSLRTTDTRNSVPDIFSTTPSSSSTSSSVPIYVTVAVVGTAVVILAVVILYVRRNRRVRSRKVAERASVTAAMVETEVNRSSTTVESNEISDGEKEVTDLYATVNKPQKTIIVADNGDIYTMPNKPKK